MIYIRVVGVRNADVDDCVDDDDTDDDDGDDRRVSTRTATVG